MGDVTRLVEQARELERTENLAGTHTTGLRLVLAGLADAVEELQTERDNQDDVIDAMAGELAEVAEILEVTPGVAVIPAIRAERARVAELEAGLADVLDRLDHAFSRNSPKYLSTKLGAAHERGRALLGSGEGDQT